MNSIDLIILIILAFLGILGIRRGLLSEAYFLLTTFLSIYLASRLAIILSAALAGYAKFKFNRLVFLVFLLSYGLTIPPIWAGKLVLYERFFSKRDISGVISRVGGAIFGLIKGLFIVSALIIVLLRFETGQISYDLWRAESLKLFLGVVKRLLILFPKEFSTILLDLRIRGMM